MHFRAALAAVALSACATAPAQAPWSALVGCWIDDSDAIPPASMVWRAHEDHPDVYVGTWAVSGSGDPEDADIVTFVLEPSGRGMRLCEHAPGVDVACAPAILAGRDEFATTGYAVFDVRNDMLTFGYYERPAPFYMGHRGACA